MASYRHQPTRNDRLKGWALVGGVYAALALAWWLAPHRADPVRTPEQPTVLVDVEAPPPPPPVVEQPKPKATPDKAEGAAGKKAEPSPIVAPEPKIPAPSPVPAAPVAGTGSATTAGAADRGNGPGAGGSGGGPGGGGGGTYAPQWLSGGIRDSDYPADLKRARVGGTVSVRFTVLATGRIAGCRVARSSGSGQLDALTCRLLTERLRFVPAKDGSGRAVPYELGNDLSWIPGRRGG